MIRILMYTSAVMTFLMVTTAALAGPPAKKHGGGFHGRPLGGFTGVKVGTGFKSHPVFPTSGFPGHSSIGGIRVGLGTGLGYHQQHGKAFSHGIYYAGRGHNHWTYSGYSPKYGVTCHWCPHSQCYYYWHENSGRYYPLSYIASAPPTRVIGGPPLGVPQLP